MPSCDRLITLAAVLLALFWVSRVATVHPGGQPIVCTAFTGHTCASEQPSEVLPPDFDLRKCYREECADVPATAQDYLNQLPSRFKVEVALLSKRPRVGGLTVVVSGALNRLNMIESTCTAWVGPLAAAVLLPVLAPGVGYTEDKNGRVAGAWADVDMASAEKDVRDLFARTEAADTGCQLDIVFVTELVADITMLVTYPINAMRNMAMLLARTELVYPLDIDFVVSSDLSDVVQDADRYARLLELAEARHVIVPPAFRIDKSEALAESVAAGGRRAALAAVANGTMDKFDWRIGHSPTDFDRWVNTSSSYDIDYVNGFEPWGILRRLEAPWFDNRFRGRDKNKVNWFMILHFTGFKFTIYRDAFIVHRPHPVVDDHRKSSDLNALWHNNSRWHGETYRQLVKHEYTAAVTPAFKQCQAQLPWWNEYPPEGEPAQYRTMAVPYRNETWDPQQA